MIQYECKVSIEHGALQYKVNKVHIFSTYVAKVRIEVLLHICRYLIRDVLP